MRFIKYLLAIMVTMLLISATSVFSQYVTSSTSTSSDGASFGYNAPIMDGSIAFKAKLNGAVVEMSWTQYNGDEKFKYYKVVRSATNTNPYYPDHSYIKAIGDVRENTYTDRKPLKGGSYYRVCAITAEQNRYCSNVVKVYLDMESDAVICTMEYAPVCGQSKMPKCPDGMACIQVMPQPKTYGNKCMLKADGATYLYQGECRNDEIITCTEEAKLCPDGKTYVGRTGPKCEFKKCPSSTTKPPVNEHGLKAGLKIKADNLVKSFVNKVKRKYESTDERVAIIKKVISRLEAIKDKKPRVASLINYMVDRFEEAIEEMDGDLGDIIDILNEY